MRIVIRFDDGCKDDVKAWLARLPGNPGDRRDMIDIAIEEMKRELARTTGHPPTAEYREQPPPPCYWWKYTDTCWVRYTITNSGGLFGGRTRTIDVIGLEPVPPG